MSKNIFQKLYHQDLKNVYSKFEGLILDNEIGEISDIQSYFTNLHKALARNKNVLISYHNHLWEPILELASFLGLRKKVGLQNWLDKEDIRNILELSGFEVTKTELRFFGITFITIAKPTKLAKIKNISVSIVVPARNEAGNIARIVKSIPKFGKSQEIIFVEGNSTDKTWKKIIIETKKYKNVKAYKQTGRGKADAVWLGFEKATGKILMIYDADMTVDATDLPKFYNVLASGMGSFANGSRLVYPMEGGAMQTLNKMGNKIFSSIFTWIFGTRFKDTLCGTKVLFKKDYLYMKKHNKNYFKMDPFGDFALIFGAIKNKLKVVEVPIRYKERVYGSTNISRFKHGLLLLKMTLVAFKEFKL